MYSIDELQVRLAHVEKAKGLAALWANRVRENHLTWAVSKKADDSKGARGHSKQNKDKKKKKCRSRIILHQGVSIIKRHEFPF